MRFLFGGFEGGRTGTALLLLRVIVGVAMMLHGWPKVQDAADFASKVGVPSWLGALAAWSEFAGGAVLALGLLTPIAALLLAGTMVGALALVHLPKGDPFVSTGGASYELAAVYLVATVALLLTGPGRFSLDAALFGRGGGARKPSPRKSQ